MGLENLVNAFSKIIVIIVTFNPDLELLRKNIISLSDKNVRVLISDNNSLAKQKLNEMCTEFSDNDLTVLYSNRNNGLAEAQNKGISYAKENGFDYVCFFDQDTIIPNKYANSMLDEFKIAEKKFPDKKIGMLAPNYYDYRIKEFAHFAKLTRNKYEDVKFNGEHFLEVSFVVSSGSVIKVETINKIGLLQEKFFIDQIDTEYSLRLLKNGYSILVTSKVLLKHTIGSRDKKRFLWLTIKPNNHSALRKYYIFRNGTRTVKDYESLFPGFKYLMFKRFVHDILGVLLYESEKREKISAIIKGVKDGRLKIERWK
ncbi:glycosyltransferase [Lactiplantibacillus plantarum]|nr:glycosyltransferase [Lactiplantibacillus plantarum]